MIIELLGIAMGVGAAGVSWRIFASVGFEDDEDESDAEALDKAVKQLVQLDQQVDDLNLALSEMTNLKPGVERILSEHFPRVAPEIVTAQATRELAKKMAEQDRAKMSEKDQLILMLTDQLKDAHAKLDRAKQELAPKPKVRVDPWATEAKQVMDDFGKEYAALMEAMRGKK